MKQKTYIIRKVAYHYSDEYLYVHTLGGIQDIYHDELQAKQKLQGLESQQFKALDLGDIEQLSPCGYPNTFKQQRELLDQYLQQILGKSLFHKNSYDGRLHMEMGTYLPNHFTDEQIMQIREITGIKFYELAVFEDEVVFYGIWITQAKEFYRAEGGGYGESSYFFNSYEQAMAYIKESLPDFIWDKPLQGKLEDLTEQPSILMSLIDQSDSLKYDPKNAILEIDYRLQGEELISLNAILKQPIFEIRTISLSDAKKIPHAPFEVM